MGTVRNTLKRPGGAPASGRVVIELLGDGGRPVHAYVTADGYTIEAYDAFTADGEWSRDLVANALINPAGTRWRVTETVDGVPAVHVLNVRDEPGTFFVEDILSDPPGSVASPALHNHIVSTDPHPAYALDTDVTAHVANGVAAHAASAVAFTPTGDLVATTVQAALAELDTEKARLVDGKLDPAQSATNVVFISGLDTTGANAASNTTTIDAAIAAAPKGATLLLPVGIIAYTALAAFGDGKTLEGGGWYSAVDALQAFGDIDYLNNTYFGGTVLRSTAASGASITVVGPLVSQGHLRNLAVIGPGSGTAVGIAVGSAVRGFVGAKWSNVLVCNFATGLEVKNLNEGEMALTIRGCTTGMKLNTNCNNNLWPMLDIQRCVTGLTLDATCITNLFSAPLFQGNTGVSVVLAGQDNILDTPYFENAAGTLAVDVAAGSANGILNPRLATVNDGITIQEGVVATVLTNPTSAGNPTITNLGRASVLIGDFLIGLTLVTPGPQTLLLDAHSDKVILPELVAPLKMAAAVGGQAIVSWEDAGAAPAWQFYKIHGDPKIYLRDLVNARMAATFLGGATDNVSSARFGGVLIAGSSTTAGRPNAGNFAAGGMWYDTTLGKPIWTNGVGWRAHVMHLSASAVWDPAAVATGATTSTTVTVAGAALGDIAHASFSLAVPAGALLTANVTAVDTVTVTLANFTGAVLDLASGTLRVTVEELV